MIFIIRTACSKVNLKILTETKLIKVESTKLRNGKALWLPLTLSEKASIRKSFNFFSKVSKMEKEKINVEE